MSTQTAAPAQHLADVGEVLRHWRGVRRISQMEVAHMAEVSPRHLSFVENGHARASREVLGRLGAVLDLPLRERNRLLLATGYAPEYREAADVAVHDPAIVATLRQIMEAAQPFPAVVFDRHWSVVALNVPAAIFLEGAPAHLLEPPLSTLRLLMHPDGIGHRVVEHDRLYASMLNRLARQTASTGDPVLGALHRELSAYVGELSASPAGASALGEQQEIAELFRIRYRGHLLAFMSTVATIGQPRDVLTSELAIETFYPADARTRELLSRPGFVAPEHAALVHELMNASPL